jgi:hypothetical protein
MFKASPARCLCAASLVGVLAGQPLAALAQVYKCPQANGTVGYQGTPCPTHDKPAARPTMAQLNAQQAAAPRNDKPFDDPYAKSVDSPAHPDTPSAQAPPPPTSVARAPAKPQETSTSRMVADVQARNRREAEQQAYQQAHQNDKVVNMAACNSARHDLGVLNVQQPVFSYDNKGNRVYVEDKDRAARIADTQRTISTSCP